LPEINSAIALSKSFVIDLSILADTLSAAS
jgi:hypothetical protein